MNIWSIVNHHYLFETFTFQLRVKKNRSFFPIPITFNAEGKTLPEREYSKVFPVKTPLSKYDVFVFRMVELESEFNGFYWKKIEF